MWQTKNFIIGTRKESQRDGIHVEREVNYTTKDSSYIQVEGDMDYTTKHKDSSYISHLACEMNNKVGKLLPLQKESWNNYSTHSV